MYALASFAGYVAGQLGRTGSYRASSMLGLSGRIDTGYTGIAPSEGRTQGPIPLRVGRLSVCYQPTYGRTRDIFIPPFPKTLVN